MYPSLLFGEPSRAFKPPSRAFKFTKPSLNEPGRNVFGIQGCWNLPTSGGARSKVGGKEKEF